MCLQYKSFENNVGKRETARNEHFVLYPRVFFTLLEIFQPFSSNSKLSSATSFSLEDSLNLFFGKRLNLSMLKSCVDNKFDMVELTLPNNKFFVWSKLKAFADDKTNVTYKQKFFLGWMENIVGKGENAGNQHFLLFSQCFQRLFYTGLLNPGTVW